MRWNDWHLALALTAGHIRIEWVPTKKPGRGEILIAPHKVGICGTDLQIIRRQRPDTATILGHEGIARVVAVGPGVTKFVAGQQVVLNPVNPRNQYDILGHSTEGLFQQYLLVSQDALERGMVVPFDTSLPHLYGPLVEPLGTVVYGHALVGQVCRPRYVAVIGAGPIGLLHASYARAQGAHHVFLVHTYRERLDWAIGRHIVDADEVFLYSSDLAATLLMRTNGWGVDAVYLCTTRTGALAALEQVLSFVRPGGCIDLVGGIGDGDALPQLPGIELNSIRRANCCGHPQHGVIARCRTLEGSEIYLTGHRGTSAEHLQRALKLLRENALRYTSILSHVVSLPAAPTLLERLVAANSRRIDGEEYVKVIIDFTSVERSSVQKC